MTDPSRPADFNPYAAPGDGPEAETPTNVYRIDSRNISYLEYRGMAASPVAFLVMAVLKTIRVPIRFPFGFPRPIRLDRIDRSERPAHVAEALSEGASACEEAGLRFRFAYKAASIGPNREAFAILFQSVDGRELALLSYGRSRSAAIERADASITVINRLTDGQWVGSTNAPAGLSMPPSYQVRRLKRFKPADLISSHRAWVERHGFLIEALPVDEEELARLQLSREQEYIDYQINRGLFVRMTAGELARMHRTAEEQPLFNEATKPNTIRGRWFQSLVGLIWLGLLVLLLYLIIVPARTPAQERFQVVATLGAMAISLVVLVIAVIRRGIQRRRRT